MSALYKDRYPMTQVKSAVHQRYDMTAVVYPSGRKLYGTCLHANKFVTCNYCHFPRGEESWTSARTANWIDGSNLTYQPLCGWCETVIEAFSPYPYTELVLTQTRQWVIRECDPTHHGERGLWYKAQNRRNKGNGVVALHWACYSAGEPVFHTFDNDDTQHSAADAAKEWDGSIMRKHAVEDAEDSHRPTEDMPFNDDRWATVIQEAREEAYYSSMCGPVTIRQLERKIKCGNCKQLHPTPAAVKKCYSNMRSASQKKGK